MQWCDSILQLRPRDGLTSDDFDLMIDTLHIQCEDELLGHNWLENYGTEILDACHKRTDPSDIVQQQHHLYPQQQSDLLGILSAHPMLFNDTLGIYPHTKVHIDIDSDAEPVHVRAYTMPRIHLSNNN